LGRIVNQDIDLHSKTKLFLDSPIEIINKHAPEKIPRNKLEQKIYKPWITNGLLKSIKVKQKMYRTHFLNNNARKVEDI
jgi:c-di-GMP-related signal transduction protein